MMAALTLYLFLNLYAAASGVKDAVLWSKKGAEAFSWNEHKIFVIERTIICFALYTVLYLRHDQLLVVIAAFVLSFSFWHNGCYYLGRNGIQSNVYPKGFWDESASSTALLELSLVQRSLLKLFSLAVLFLL